MQTLFDEIEKASELPEIREHPELVGYGASADGRVWSRWGRGPQGLLQKWHKIKCWQNRDGHLMFSKRVNKSGRFTSIYAHRFVLEWFVGKAPNEGMECRHFPDRDPTNNRIENLQWGTRQENEEDKKIHGTTGKGGKNAMAKLTEKEILRIFELAKQGIAQHRIGKEVGVQQQQISRILSGKRWGHFNSEVANGDKA